jgi:DNA-binding transcriptional ArsR family regulator
MEGYDPQTRLFKALTHPVRLAILDILRDGDECVCHIEALLGLRQAYISQQLAVLREAGLVQDRREGWNIFYQVIQPEVFGLLDLAAQLSGTEGGDGSERGGASYKEIACPCPKCAAASEELLAHSYKEEKC